MLSVWRNRTGNASVLVCYSGGVDSALVLAVAYRARQPSDRPTAVSPSFAPFEKKAAIAIASPIGARHLWSSHGSTTSYQNDVDRFYCKWSSIRSRRQKVELGVAHHQWREHRRSRRSPTVSSVKNAGCEARSSKPA
jgi:PP-loop superfamily ATP-utilizing enzyme